MLSGTRVGWRRFKPDLAHLAFDLATHLLQEFGKNNRAPKLRHVPDPDLVVGSWSVALAFVKMMISHPVAADNDVEGLVVSGAVISWLLTRTFSMKKAANK